MEQIDWPEIHIKIIKAHVDYFIKIKNNNKILNLTDKSGLNNNCRILLLTCRLHSNNIFGENQLPNDASPESQMALL